MTTTRPSTAPSTVASAERSPLTISVRLGLGTGPTRLAAFDDALLIAGVADRNLIRLSSIIPPGSTVTREGPFECPGGWGDRLYVVMAEERVETHHEEAWAGIAWCQDLDTRQGLFVEHEGHSRQQVESDLEATLTSMRAARPDHDWGPIELAVTGAACEGAPICALAIAAYEHEPWRGSVIDLRDPAPEGP